MRGGTPSLPECSKPARLCITQQNPPGGARFGNERDLKVLRCESILPLSSPAYNWVHDLSYRPDGQDEAPFQ